MIRRSALAIALALVFLTTANAASFPSQMLSVRDEVVLGASEAVTPFAATLAWRTVASFTCLQANSRISTVALTAFYDCGNSAVATWADGYSRITITDTGAKTLVGYAKAAGVAESLTELITVADDRTFASDTTFWTRTGTWGISGGKASATAGAAGELYRNPVGTLGCLVKSQLDVDAQAGGFFRVYLGNGAATAVANGTSILYQTVVGVKYTYRVEAGSSATIDNVSAQQVLTPSLLGARITSTLNGTAGDAWTSNSGINLGDTTYTVVIERYY